jgi:hypothetical protein
MPAKRIRKVKTKKASDFSEAFIVVALMGQFSNHFIDDLKNICLVSEDVM